MVKKLAVVLFFYMILVVLLLPLAVTLLCGGFGKELPQEAKVLYGTGGEIQSQDILGIDFEKAE